MKRRIKAKSPSQQRPLTEPGLTLGNFDIEVVSGEFLPVVKQKAVQWFQLPIRHRAAVETALGKTLTDIHWEWVDGACTYFIFACIHKDELPTANAFIGGMSKQARLAKELTRLLLTFLFVKIDQEQVALNGTTMTAHDRLRIVASTEWTDQLHSLVELHQKLNDLETELNAFGSPTRGRPPHYELKFLLTNLSRVAQSAGGDLKITSRARREKTIGNVNKETETLKFLTVVLKSLEAELPQILELYRLSDSRRLRAEKLFQTYFKKKLGAFIEDAMKARLALEGSKRKKSTSKRA